MTKKHMPLWRLLLLLSLPVTLISCGSARQTPIAVTTVTTGCKAFRVIRWSPRDTAETVTDVRRHNASYRRLCRRS